ncbi:hypothetical protein OG455_25650 [Kitasatospora sp. NBC_01287]|uniref:hypothetical protein n=1 Tax=Kitasatospora sp. NBC_01287 TaxID=2903573 RepID=UPI00224F9BC3|nr:hypothetical protein [Kitasatospora sp. NBC_01287]MCX4748859.1 hypothetical protein [Kitasatospora sp. NBC_01287]
MEPHWMFPDLDDDAVAAVGEALALADARLGGLARRLGVRGGLRSNPVGGLPYAGEVYGYLRLPEVAFGAGLYVARRCGNDLRMGPPWLVGAEIEVPCRYGEECTGHEVAAYAEGRLAYGDPLAAARALAAACDWLAGTALRESPAGWRLRNTESCAG